MLLTIEESNVGLYPHISGKVTGVRIAADFIPAAVETSLRMYSLLPNVRLAISLLTPASPRRSSLVHLVQSSTSPAPLISFICPPCPLRPSRSFVHSPASSNSFIRHSHAPSISSISFNSFIRPPAPRSTRSFVHFTGLAHQALGSIRRSSRSSCHPSSRLLPRPPRLLVSRAANDTEKRYFAQNEQLEILTILRRAIRLKSAKIIVLDSNSARQYR